MIEARSLTKRYGATVAVNDLSFTIRPGVVTGFLGPNGAGKTTTMRLILGLDYPSAGTVTIDGRPHPQSPSPMHEVGALLDAKAVHGGRSACAAGFRRAGPGRAGGCEGSSPPSGTCGPEPGQPFTLAMTSSAYRRRFAIFSASGSWSGPTW